MSIISKVKRVPAVAGTRKLSNLRRVVPNSVSAKVGRQLLVAQKHSPAILFAGGVVGVVATTVLACRATLKLEGVLEDTQLDMGTAKDLRDDATKKYTEDDYRHDMTYLYVRGALRIIKLYLPAAGVGVLSIAALTGSHVILHSRYTGMAAAYTAVEKSYAEYRQRVVDQIGDERERELRYDAKEHVVVEDTDKGTKKVHLKKAGINGASMYARFFDKMTSRNWQPTAEYNSMFVKCQQNYANDLLRSRGHVFLNEVYDMLGMERSPEGAVVGWLLGPDGGDQIIDFGVFDNNTFMGQQFVNGNEKSILLDFNVDGSIWDKI